MKEELKHLKDLIKEYLNTNTVDDSRGQCYNETESLYWWLVDLDDPLIDLEELEVVRGNFIIDYPQKLPLTLQDLHSNEYNEFLDYYEEQVDLNDSIELSETIWHYVNNHLSESRIMEFYIIPHAWLEYYEEVFDITKNQFKNAVEDFNDIKDNYH